MPAPSHHHTIPIASAVSANDASAGPTAFAFGKEDTRLALALTKRCAKMRRFAGAMHAGQIGAVGVFSWWPRADNTTPGEAQSARPGKRHSRLLSVFFINRTLSHPLLQAE